MSAVATIFSVSVLCAGAMLLAGNGVQREPVRLACICIVLLSMLNLLPGLHFSLPDPAETELAIEQSIRSAMEEADRQQAAAIAAQLENYAEDYLRSCSRRGRATADVSCLNGTVQLRSLRITCEPLSEAEAAQLRAAFGSSLIITEKEGDFAATRENTGISQAHDR